MTLRGWVCFRAALEAVEELVEALLILLILCALDHVLRSSWSFWT